jgi:hypothetical protein
MTGSRKILNIILSTRMGKDEVEGKTLPSLWGLIGRVPRSDNGGDQDPGPDQPISTGFVGVNHKKNYHRQG